MRLYTQQHSADRDDGHTTDGIPGDCLRAAAATVLQVNPAKLRHYATYESWWTAMRVDARTKLGLDWGYSTPDLLDTWTLQSGALMIGSGPSPRGPFWHAVVVDLELELVHDPHPSRAGLLKVEDLLIVCQMYEPGPVLPALTAGVTAKP